MFIDANIYLEFLLKQENAEKAKSFITAISNKSEGKAFVSNFNLDSIIIILCRNKISIKVMEDFIFEVVNSRGISIYEMTMQDRLKAMNLMKQYNLDYEDSLTLQAAIVTSSKEIVSYDKHFDNIKEIERIEP